MTWLKKHIRLKKGWVRRLYSDGTHLSATVVNCRFTPTSWQKSTLFKKELMNTAAIIVRYDQRMSFSVLGTAWDVSKDTVLRILRHHLNMRSVLHVGSAHAKERTDGTACSNSYGMEKTYCGRTWHLSWVITKDESWFRYFDSLTKQQGYPWNSPKSLGKTYRDLRDYFFLTIVNST